MRHKGKAPGTATRSPPCVESGHQRHRIRPARLDQGNLPASAPTLAIVMIGQNNAGHNTAEETRAGVTPAVRKVRPNLARQALPVVHLSSAREPDQGTAVLAKASRIAAQLADNHTPFYMDFNWIFLHPDGSIPAELTPDFEHPSAKGYRPRAEAIEPTVAALMGDKAI